MPRRLSSLLSLLAVLHIALTVVTADTRFSLFDPSQVKLREGDFQRSLELNAQYLLAHDLDRLLAPFRIEAGLEPKAPLYGNWESSGLNGHSAGHFLSAFALMLAATDETVYRDRLDYMVKELALCQEANGNGYVGGIPDGSEMWRQIAAGELAVDRFAINGRWVPWYNIHKLYAGLKDAWTVGKSDQAKEVLLKLTDWCIELTQDLSADQMQRMLYAEHGGMNDVFAELYGRTGDERYLQLAERFSHHELLDPLVDGRDELTGFHANTQIPKVIGFQRIANVSDAPDFGKAARAFWENVVHARSVAFGGNSVREHFHATDDFTTLLESREGPESCNTHNMLRLSAQLFLQDGDSELIDYYERALFNHILSVQHPETGGFVYFTPIRPKHYRVYSQAEEAFWCCVGSGIENPGRCTELIYARGDHQLLVNLFVPSSVDWQEEDVRVIQETRFPQEPGSTLRVDAKVPRRFTLSIRRPAWSEGFSIQVNGRTAEFELNQSGYADIERTWRNGDRVQIGLPMKLNVEQLPDSSPYYAFLYGPVVLAAREGPEDTPGLFAGDGRMEHIAPGAYYPLDKAPTIVGETSSLLSSVTRISGDSLRFRLSGDIRPQPERQYILEPFHQIHGERYTMYWRALAEDDYQAVLQRVSEEEKKKQLRAARLIDVVSAGEQQPEVEHDYRGSQSRSGKLLGKTYREASEWFEYVLDTQGETSLAVSLTYWGSEWGRACAVLVDGQKIGELRCNANEPERFAEQLFPIPDDALNGEDRKRITVRVEAIDGQATPSIFETALLKQNPSIAEDDLGDQSL